MAAVVVVRAASTPARVLLMRRAGPYLAGAWSYVAGHLEIGEVLWQCALRELAEETSLRPDALYSADSCEQFYDVANECIQVVPAFVAMIADGARVHLNPEHTAFRWLTFATARGKLLFASQRELFARVQREFVDRAPPATLRLPLEPANNP